MSGLLLIEDFPQQGRRRGGLNRRFVRFSRTNRVQVFERVDGVDPGEVWYIDSDCRAMKADAKRAAHEVHRMLGSCTSPSRDVASFLIRAAEAEERITLTGIEKFLSPRLVEKAVRARTDLIEAVLLEQERQRRTGARDPHRLARAAERHTERSARRAHLIGLLNAESSP